MEEWTFGIHVTGFAPREAATSRQIVRLCTLQTRERQRREGLPLIVPDGKGPRSPAPIPRQPLPAFCLLVSARNVSRHSRVRLGVLNIWKAGSCKFARVP